MTAVPKLPPYCLFYSWTTVLKLDILPYHATSTYIFLTHSATQFEIDGSSTHLAEFALLTPRERSNKSGGTNLIGAPEETRTPKILLLRQTRIPIPSPGQKIWRTLKDSNLCYRVEKLSVLGH